MDRTRGLSQTTRCKANALPLRQVPYFFDGYYYSSMSGEHSKMFINFQPKKKGKSGGQALETRNIKI